MKERVRALLLAGLVVATPAALSQTFPTKPIRIIVPFGVGGPNDILARFVGHKLTETWGQQVIVDNRPGAGTIIGTEAAARAAPDGYTLMIAATSHATNPSRARKLSFDPVRDFAPITLLGVSPTAFIVHPSMPVNSVADLIAFAKQRPGQVSFGSGGVGTAIHLAFELLCLQSGIKMVHVPFHGQAPGIVSVMRGEVPWMFAGVMPTLAHIRSGRLRAIAVSSPQRVNLLPDVPLVADTLPGFEALPWYGMFAPAGTQKDVIAKLNHAIASGLRVPEVQKRLQGEGMEVVASSPEEFGTFFQAEIERWAKVIKQAGIRLE
jgi:tripartite-type tricarboxylate transporter receptor subunit TctC